MRQVQLPNRKELMLLLLAEMIFGGVQAWDPGSSEERGLEGRLERGRASGAVAAARVQLWADAAPAQGGVAQEPGWQPPQGGSVLCFHCNYN